MHLPYLTSDVPGVPGRLRATPEDFRVDEVPAYLPEGRGTHLFVRFEKRDLTTPEATKRLARALDIPPDRVGFAGLKDRDAVTTQWASFEGGDPERALGLELEGIRILEAALHANKLRTGHLRGNRFRLVVRDVPEDRQEDVRRVLERLERDGLPNYYGEQRFGRDGDNLPRALAWIVEGGRAPKAPFERKMLASVFQSELFNRRVAARVRAGELARVFLGDLVRKEDTGGMFVALDVEEANERSARWALSPTGPMFGPEMRWPEADARAIEEALLAEVGMTPADLSRLGKAAPGTRRPVRIRPADLSWEWNAGSIVLGFELPAGSYATVLTRELLKGDAAPPERR
ncbi:MAG: tRNA pseudouridine(13) synthase TruD [Polyangiales bacterium]